MKGGVIVWSGSVAGGLNHRGLWACNLSERYTDRPITDLFGPLISFKETGSDVIMSYEGSGFLLKEDSYHRGWYHAFSTFPLCLRLLGDL